jgi:hypothetical protein
MASGSPGELGVLPDGLRIGRTVVYGATASAGSCINLQELQER